MGEMHRQVYESHGTAPQEFGTTQDYLYPIWLMFYLFYLSDLFEILGCPFLNGHFSTHATSYSLLCAVSHIVNLLLSVSLTHSAAYFLLCFYLPLIYIKGNQFVWPASLNKLIWINVVPELRFAHNNNVAMLCWVPLWWVSWRVSQCPPKLCTVCLKTYVQVTFVRAMLVWAM
jgi:hypothetical protein